MLVLKYPFISE